MPHASRDIFANRSGSRANNSRIPVASIFGLCAASACHAGDCVRFDMAASRAQIATNEDMVGPVIELVHLRTLASRFPNVEAALARIAGLEAALALPTPTIHVVSDVHGEHEKLRQVINNASGSLRPFVANVLQLPPHELDELLALVYYPHETWAAKPPIDPPAAALAFTERGAAIIRALAARYTIEHVEAIIP